MSPVLNVTPVEGVVDATGERLWPPPEEVKRLHLLNVFAERGHEVFVESGTYLGGTVDYFLPHARRIFSIELAPKLFADAAERFAGTPHVTILEGDATVHVPRIVGDLDEPPLIFLDGHYSCGETACGDEVEPALTILGLLGAAGVPAGTTIVIDDVRTFHSRGVGLSLEELIGTCRRCFPDAEISCNVDALVVLI